MRSHHTSPAHRGHRIAGSLDPDNCLCGARVADGDTTCRKCDARARWHRRSLGNRRSTALLLAVLLTVTEVH